MPRTAIAAAASRLMREDRGPGDAEPEDGSCRGVLHGGLGATPKRFRCDTGRTEPIVGVFTTGASAAALAPPPVAAAASTNARCASVV